MAKRETIVNGNVASFEMGIKLDGNDDRSYKIAVEMDFEGVPRERLVEWNASGSSRRVLLQGALRKTSAERLEKLEREGLTVHASSVTDLKTKEEKADEAIKNLLATGLSKEEILARLA